MEDNTGDVFLYQGLEVLGVLVVTFQAGSSGMSRDRHVWQDAAAPGDAPVCGPQLAGCRTGDRTMEPAYWHEKLACNVHSRSHAPQCLQWNARCGTRGKHMGLQEKELARCYASYRQLSQQVCERLGVDLLSGCMP